MAKAKKARDTVLLRMLNTPPKEHAAMKTTREGRVPSQQELDGLAVEFGQSDPKPGRKPSPRK